MGASGVAMGLVSAWQFTNLTPIERFSRVWEKDSSRLRLPPPSFSVAPIQIGNKTAGGMLTVSGVF